MTRYQSIAMGLSIAAVLSAGAVAFAATTILTNGGLGQVAGNTQSFGLAICNGGKQAVAQSVPVVVGANGKTVTISSPSALQPGVCGYSYANYGDLAMAPGQTYSVNVTIDPGHTVISNVNNLASYSVSVPGTPVAAAPSTAEPAGSQPTNFLATIGAAFANFFATIKSWF